MADHPLHHATDSAVHEMVDRRLEDAVRAAQVLTVALSEPELMSQVEAAGGALLASLRAGGTLLVVGNGGSAAIASHIAAEFVGKCIQDRLPLPAVSLAESLSSVTAVANDYGFDEVFVRGVHSLGRPGDCLLAMSTSGNSPNVVRAVEAARDRGLVTIAMTGVNSGALTGLADHTLAVPSTSTPRIQEIHLLWAHAWCEAADLLGSP